MNITRLSICSLVIVFTALALGSHARGSTASDDSELLRISILRINALVQATLQRGLGIRRTITSPFKTTVRYLQNLPSSPELKPRLIPMHLGGLEIRQYA
jgi:hypothetical protein